MIDEDDVKLISETIIELDESIDADNVDSLLSSFDKFASFDMRRLKPKIKSIHSVTPELEDISLAVDDGVEIISKSFAELSSSDVDINQFTNNVLSIASVSDELYDISIAVGDGIGILADSIEKLDFQENIFNTRKDNIKANVEWLGTIAPDLKNLNTELKSESVDTIEAITSLDFGIVKRAVIKSNIKWASGLIETLDTLNTDLSSESANVITSITSLDLDRKQRSKIVKTISWLKDKIIPQLNDISLDLDENLFTLLDKMKPLEDLGFLGRVKITKNVKWLKEKLPLELAEAISSISQVKGDYVSKDTSLNETPIEKITEIEKNNETILTDIIEKNNETIQTDIIEKNNETILTEVIPEIIDITPQNESNVLLETQQNELQIDENEGLIRNVDNKLDTVTIKVSENNLLLNRLVSLPDKNNLDNVFVQAQAEKDVDDKVDKKDDGVSIYSKIKSSIVEFIPKVLSSGSLLTNIIPELIKKIPSILKGGGKFLLGASGVLAIHGVVTTLLSKAISYFFDTSEGSLAAEIVKNLDSTLLHNLWNLAKVVPEIGKELLAWGKIGYTEASDAIRSGITSIQNSAKETWLTVTSEFEERKKAFLESDVVQGTIESWNVAKESFIELKNQVLDSQFVKDAISVWGDVKNSFMDLEVVQDGIEIFTNIKDTITTKATEMLDTISNVLDVEKVGELITWNFQKLYANVANFSIDMFSGAIKNFSDIPILRNVIGGKIKEFRETLETLKVEAPKGEPPPVFSNVEKKAVPTPDIQPAKSQVTTNKTTSIEKKETTKPIIKPEEPQVTTNKPRSIEKISKPTEELSDELRPELTKLDKTNTITYVPYPVHVDRHHYTKEVVQQSIPNTLTVNNG